MLHFIFWRPVFLVKQPIYYSPTDTEARHSWIISIVEIIFWSDMAITACTVLWDLGSAKREQCANSCLMDYACDSLCILYHRCLHLAILSACLIPAGLLLLLLHARFHFFSWWVWSSSPQAVRGAACIQRCAASLSLSVFLTRTPAAFHTAERDRGGDRCLAVYPSVWS